MANIKKCFIALVFCLGLLFQPILDASQSKSSEAINHLILNLIGLTSGLLLSSAELYITLSNGVFGVDLSSIEKLGVEHSLPPLVLPIAGYFALVNVQNLLKNVLAGNAKGVLNNAKIIGYSGLAALAAGFAVNNQFVRSFIEGNLDSIGMISGMTSAVGSVLSNIGQILNPTAIAWEVTASKKIRTSIDIQGAVSDVDQMTKKIARIINTILPAAIEERISALINRQVEGIEFFSTPKQKIWALQNIEDFLVFPYGLEEKGSAGEKAAKNLNPYIYRAVMKHIHELQSTLMVAVDENGNEIWADKDENNKAIDDLCEQYRKDFNISVKALRDMKPEVLDQTIQKVAAALGDIKDRKDADNEKMAMISILYHLLYKKINQKQAVLIEKSLQNAQEQVAGKSQYVEQVKSQFTAGQDIKEIKKPESSSATWLRELFSAKKPQVVTAESMRQTQQKVQPKPAQQRSGISAWWNWLFGSGD